MDYSKNVFVKPKGFLGKALSNLFLIVCIYLVVMMYAFSATYVGVNVDGDCMENLYFNNDIVYYLPTQNVSYGDVVVFKVSDTQDYMKRIIGLEGDRVNFNVTTDESGQQHYVITLNGTPLKEDYLKDQEGLKKTYNNMYLGQTSLLATHSEDFEEGNSVRKDYVVQEGEFFALGDNRAVSKDSSYLGGFKFNNIKGKVEYRVREGKNTLLELFSQFFWPF